MKLIQLVNQYVQFRKSLGEKFTTSEKILKRFCKLLSKSSVIESITRDQINDFLYGGSITIKPGWFHRYTALSGFYRYAFTRNYVTEIPLPQILPKRPPQFVPYIYSRKELKLIFDGALTYQRRNGCNSPYTVRTILIITYALGLRIHETISISLADIDINSSVITIQKSKFYKSRLIPFNQALKEIISEYLLWRIKKNYSQSSGSPLFVGKHNKPFSLSTIRNIFCVIRKDAGIKRDDNVSYQPRIHDLRHTFAVKYTYQLVSRGKRCSKIITYPFYLPWP
ncbi:MAG: tyrosine-type recombinase/integrase [Proteobacteria bacterium]|nr:tyrosine-type recombinase/integrase [Pseudomonadota bacterium]